MSRKGIILAGGNGTRLYPLTSSISKQLLPVYNKPMVYYPLSTLMSANIQEILIISSPKHMSLYKSMFGNGDDYGISISYEIQEKPRGIPEAFIIGEDFIGKDSVCLILGDNIFYGGNLEELLLKATISNFSSIFSSEVKDPERFGVVELDQNNEILNVVENQFVEESFYLCLQHRVLLLQTSHLNIFHFVI